MVTLSRQLGLGFTQSRFLLFYRTVLCLFENLCLVIGCRVNKMGSKKRVFTKEIREGVIICLRAVD